VAIIVSDQWVSPVSSINQSINLSTHVLLTAALLTNNHNTNSLVIFFYRSNSFRTNRNCQPT